MPAYNQVTMLGNLTRDPELSYTPNQTAVTDFGMAVNSKWTAGDGTVKEDVCFIEVRAFGRVAENLNKYMKKGSLLLVWGRLAYETWTSKDKEQTKHSRHRLIVNGCQFMPDGQGKGPGAGDDSAPVPRTIDDSDIPL
jgi:single-strand DNA-binding protein